MLASTIIIGLNLAAQSAVALTPGTVDSTAPIVTITSPTIGTILTIGTRAITGTASDGTAGSGVSNVQVSIDAGSYTTATPKATGDWSTWSRSVNIATAGSHTIHAKGTDKAGNVKTISTTITVTAPDTTLPSVAITSPTSGATVSLSALTVRGTSSDTGSGISKVQIQLDSASYITASPKSSGDWSTWSGSFATMTAGSHTIHAKAIDKAGNYKVSSLTIMASSTPPPPPPPTGSTLDKFGIKELYPTKTGGNEWYVNMNDPKSDTNFKNLPSMTKQSDGSWQVSASQVRMEAWSPQNTKWQNIEITEYAKMVGGTNELLQLYSRGGHHTNSDQCLGSAYKGRLYGDGHTTFVKEVTHPAYTSNKDSTQATSTPLMDRWIGFKTIIYNFVENGKTYVHLESYIDNDVTDSNGNLVVKNNWKLASVVEDKGGWSTTNSDFNASCFPVNKDSTQQYRQRDEILNLPGGTSTQNIAGFRSDDLTWNWKYLSVREIVP
jgi:hypothetical protein